VVAIQVRLPVVHNPVVHNPVAHRQPVIPACSPVDRNRVDRNRVDRNRVDRNRAAHRRPAIQDRNLEVDTVRARVVRRPAIPNRAFRQDLAQDRVDHRPAAHRRATPSQAFHPGPDRVPAVLHRVVHHPVTRSQAFRPEPVRVRVEVRFSCCLRMNQLLRLQVAPVVAVFHRLEWTRLTRVRDLAQGAPEEEAFLLLACQHLAVRACWDLARPARA
jgi:hypothetical protein